MKLKILLLASAISLVACDSRTEDPAKPSDGYVAASFYRSLGGDYQVRAVLDMKRGNVCYVATGSHAAASPAIHCLKDTPAKPDCTPPQTDADGTTWPGTCPSEHVAGGF